MCKTLRGLRVGLNVYHGMVRLDLSRDGTDNPQGYGIFQNQRVAERHHMLALPQRVPAAASLTRTLRAFETTCPFVTL